MKLDNKVATQTEYTITLTEDEMLALKIILGSLIGGEFEAKCKNSIHEGSEELSKRAPTIDACMYSDIVNYMRGYDNYGKAIGG